MHVKVVSERLGHASVAFTLDVYGHVIPGMDRDAAAIVAALMDGGNWGILGGSRGFGAAPFVIIP